MNAIEIKGLVKNFKENKAISNLNMTVPVGSIYGFIGENGSGKSTTEKIICGLIKKDGGAIKIFGRDLTDEEVHFKMSSLIETPGCYNNHTVWNNLIFHALNLGLKNPKEKVREVLKLVRMEGAAGNKFKNCSLGMRQRVAIAMALLGNPQLIILDEPINGLDVDGMRIVREVLLDLSQNHNVTILVSSHILGELQKIATHYGIIRNGKMIKEMTSNEFENECRNYVILKSKDNNQTKKILEQKYDNVKEDEKGYLKVYDAINSSDVVKYLYNHGIVISEVAMDKISLEEYYIDLMKGENNG